MTFDSFINSISQPLFDPAQVSDLAQQMERQTAQMRRLMEEQAKTLSARNAKQYERLLKDTTNYYKYQVTTAKNRVGAGVEALRASTQIGDLATKVDLAEMGTRAIREGSDDRYGQDAITALLTIDPKNPDVITQLGTGLQKVSALRDEFEEFSPALAAAFGMDKLKVMKGRLDLSVERAARDYNGFKDVVDAMRGPSGKPPRMTPQLRRGVDLYGKYVLSSVLNNPDLDPQFKANMVSDMNAKLGLIPDSAINWISTAVLDDSTMVVGHTVLAEVLTTNPDLFEDVAVSEDMQSAINSVQSGANAGSRARSNVVGALEKSLGQVKAFDLMGESAWFKNLSRTLGVERAADYLKKYREAVDPAERARLDQIVDPPPMTEKEVKERNEQLISTIGNALIGWGEWGLSFITTGDWDPVNAYGKDALSKADITSEIEANRRALRVNNPGMSDEAALQGATDLVLGKHKIGASSITGADPSVMKYAPEVVYGDWVQDEFRELYDNGFVMTVDGSVPEWDDIVVQRALETKQKDTPFSYAMSTKNGNEVLVVRMDKVERDRYKKLYEDVQNGLEPEHKLSEYLRKFMAPEDGPFHDHTYTPNPNYEALDDRYEQLLERVKMRESVARGQQKNWREGANYYPSDTAIIDPLTEMVDEQTSRFIMLRSRMRTLDKFDEEGLSAVEQELSKKPLRTMRALRQEALRRRLGEYKREGNEEAANFVMGLLQRYEDPEYGIGSIMQKISPEESQYYFGRRIENSGKRDTRVEGGVDWPPEEEEVPGEMVSGTWTQNEPEQVPGETVRGTWTQNPLPKEKPPLDLPAEQEVEERETSDAAGNFNRRRQGQFFGDVMGLDWNPEKFGGPRPGGSPRGLLGISKRVVSDREPTRKRKFYEGTSETDSGGSRWNPFADFELDKEAPKETVKRSEWPDFSFSRQRQMTLFREFMDADWHTGVFSLERHQEFLRELMKRYSQDKGK